MKDKESESLPGISRQDLEARLMSSRILQIRKADYDRVRRSLQNVLLKWWWELKGKNLSSDQIMDLCKGDELMQSPQFTTGDEPLKVAIGIILQSLIDEPVGDIRINKEEIKNIVFYRLDEIG